MSCTSQDVGSDKYTYESFSEYMNIPEDDEKEVFMNSAARETLRDWLKEKNSGGIAGE